MPSFNTFIEYYLGHIFLNTNSLKVFYSIFFKNIKHDKDYSDQLYNEKAIFIRYKDMKNFYQKFCFVCRMEEMDLSSKMSKKML